MSDQQETEEQPAFDFEWDDATPYKKPRAPRGSSKDPMFKRRQKLVKALMSQKELAEDYAENGQPNKQVGTRSPSIWWFKASESGDYRIRVRYARHVLAPNGREALKAGNTMEDVVDTLEKLIDAANAKYFDAEIEKASRQMASDSKTALTNARASPRKNSSKNARTAAKKPVGRPRKAG